MKTDFLSLLTKQALADQDQILFYEASMLLKRIQERDVLLVSSLKDKIIIDSPWSYSFYFKVIKLKADLLAELSEYSLENDNKDYSVTRRGVAKAMESINYLFYEFANVPEDAMVRISPFAQNILR